MMGAMAPKGGIEPPTKRLTVFCSAAELLWNWLYYFNSITKKVFMVNLVFVAILLTLAEVVGFEPTDLLQSTVFKTAPFNHSGTLP